jgi:hypothetical protein
MYTFKHYVYGHDLSKEPELNNGLWEFDLCYSKVINDKEFEIEYPYHGGQISGDVYSCIFGCIITDDDNNDNLISEIQNFKKEDYEKDYLTFIDFVKKDLIDNKGIDDDTNYDSLVDKIISFLDSNEPKLYTVEASS